MASQTYLFLLLVISYGGISLAYFPQLNCYPAPRYDSCRDSIEDLKALIEITQALKPETTCPACTTTLSEDIIVKLVNALIYTATQNCGFNGKGMGGFPINHNDGVIGYGNTGGAIGGGNNMINGLTDSSGVPNSGGLLGSGGHIGGGNNGIGNGGGITGNPSNGGTGGASNPGSVLGSGGNLGGNGGGTTGTPTTSGGLSNSGGLNGGGTNTIPSTPGTNINQNHVLPSNTNSVANPVSGILPQDSILSGNNVLSAPNSPGSSGSLIPGNLLNGGNAVTPGTSSHPTEPTGNILGGVNSLVSGLTDGVGDILKPVTGILS